MYMLKNCASSIETSPNCNVPRPYLFDQTANTLIGAFGFDNFKATKRLLKAAKIDFCLHFLVHSLLVKYVYMFH